MSGPAERGDLPLELLSLCLSDAFALGYRQLSISGGEPLLYKPLAALLANARQLGMITTVTSNGMLMTRERWKPLAPLVDVLAISIDGTPSEHDLIRRQNGAFDRTIANLEIIRSSHVAFGFIFTLTQHNVDSLEFVVHLAAAHGARSVHVHPLTLHGRAEVMLPNSRPDGIELTAALIEATRLGSELGIAVHVDAVTTAQALKYRDHLVPSLPVRNITEVAPILIVEPDGAVMPLTHELSRTLQIGSLLQARLSSLVAEWVADGRGDSLAAACQRTWVDLTQTELPSAVYWYDEVAARTKQTGDIMRITA